ncbi:MAG: hypothetical protein COT15_00285 [Candidatus Diapherotrites archaeon CG08_land_8_20_14_0_20_34_12]|nr:MAG: hypothetical protein COT15_00285 [Candidatus Diapherotrites archaeon CG08_land_8_20_14_0_20_34_12]
MRKCLIILLLLIFTSLANNVFAAETSIMQCPNGTTNMSWDKAYKEPMTIYLGASDCIYSLQVSGIYGFSNKAFTLMKKPSVTTRNITIKCDKPSDSLKIKQTFLDFDMGYITGTDFITLKNCSIDATQLSTAILNISKVPAFNLENVSINGKDNAINIKDNGLITIDGKNTSKLKAILLLNNNNAVNIQDIEINGLLGISDVKKLVLRNNKIVYSHPVLPAALTFSSTIPNQESFFIANNTFKNETALNKEAIFIGNIFAPLTLNSNKYEGFDVNVMLNSEDLYDTITFTKDTSKIMLEAPSCTNALSCPEIDCLETSCRIFNGTNYCEYNLLKTRPGCFTKGFLKINSINVYDPPKRIDVKVGICYDPDKCTTADDITYITTENGTKTLELDPKQYRFKLSQALDTDYIVSGWSVNGKETLLFDIVLGETDVIDIQITKKCAANTDCSAMQCNAGEEAACVNKACGCSPKQAGCKTAADCPEKESQKANCVNSVCKYVDEEPPNPSCSSNADCPEGQKCAIGIGCVTLTDIIEEVTTIPETNIFLILLLIIAVLGTIFLKARTK